MALNFNFFRNKVVPKSGRDRSECENTNSKQTDNTIREFKTNAWQSNINSERYHNLTKAAPSIFQVVRENLYIQQVTKYVSKGSKILDLGCGSGLISMELADLGYDVVSCDVSPGMLGVLDREKGNRSIETRLGDAYSIPANAGEFDLVISRMFIQHFSDWPRIIAEKSRVTRKGGYVIFDFGNREHVEASGLSVINDCEFPYDDNINNITSYYAVASESEMLQAASDAGLVLEKIIPSGLLLYNGFLWKEYGKEGIEKLNKQLDELLSRDGAKDMLCFIENNVLPLLPKQTTYGNFIILRK
jgi:ubiquinone/menaquinone biosynthesis C-methylase UbiE